MTALRVLLIIAVACWLITLIRIGGEVQYSRDGFLVRVCAGPLRFTVFPMKPGKKKTDRQKKKEKAQRKSPEQPEAEKKGGSWKKVKKYLPLIGQAAGELKRKIRIDRIMFHLTWATSDPAFTAVGFGAGNAALGMIWPLIENNFKVLDRDVGVAMDFEQSEPTLYAEAALSLTIGQGISFGARYGLKFFRIYRANRPKHQRKSKTNHQKEAVKHE